MNEQPANDLLDIVRELAPQAGWNAETDFKFVRQMDGAFHAYDPELDCWFVKYEFENVQIAPIAEVKTWIKDIAASVGARITAF